MEEQSANPVRTRDLLGKIFYRPSEVFAAQKQEHVWGRVFILLVMISLASGWLLDFSSVFDETDGLHTNISTPDIETDYAARDPGSEARSVGINIGEADSESGSANRVSAATDDRRDGAMPMVLFVLSMLFGVAIALLFDALYLRIVSAIMGLGVTIDHWFALVAWARLPSEALFLCMTVVLVGTLFISNELFGTELLALKALVDGYASPYPSLRYFLDIWLLPEIWFIALQTLGFRDWSGRSTLLSFAIVVAPFIFLHVLTAWLLS